MFIIMISLKLRSTNVFSHSKIMISVYYWSRPFSIMPSLQEMKSSEKELRRFIIDSQLSLRKDVQEKGDEYAEQLWLSRIKDKRLLEQYAETMYKLSKDVWDKYKKMNLRISWTRDNICKYYDSKINGCIKEERRRMKFFKELQEEFKEREKFYDLKRADKFAVKPLEILDVGSCYNPFGIYKEFNVTAIDICPATPEVKVCDFLTVNLKKRMEYEIKFPEQPCSKIPEENINFNLNSIVDIKCGNDKKINKNTPKSESKPMNSIKELYEDSFDAVIFCQFISYIPSPRLRLLCCQKAFDLLRVNGLLCIITPVSTYSFVNSHFADIWKLTLEYIGFQLIEYKEHKHFHGLIFRKSICKNLFKLEAVRELEELIYRKQSFDANASKMFSKLNYDAIFKHFYIHQDLIGC